MGMKNIFAATSLLASLAFTGQGVVGGMPRDFNSPYIPPLKPIPFSFKKYKRKEGEVLPKGCKCERVKLEFVKPSYPIKYRITVEVDLVYGTVKSRGKKLLQYQNEIGYYLYHTDINKIRVHKDDIQIEEILPEKTEDVIVINE